MDGMTSVLRVHPEPFEYVDERAVHAALTADPAGYVGFFERSLKEIALGATTVELPPKRMFSDGEGQGDFRVMPCVSRNGTTVTKTVKIVGTNTVQVEVPDQITVGKAFCLHPEENYVTHVFEACLLSSARTGACAAVAAAHLVPERRRVAIVGAGRVGFYAGLYVAAYGGVEEIAFYDLDRERAADAARLLSEQVGNGTRCVAEDAPPAQADVLVLATISRAPVLLPANVETQLVMSLGADIEHQHELDPAWALAADVYVDTLDSVRVGDLRAWLASGAITRERLTDLLGVVRDGRRGRGVRPRVFISTGSALFDNVTIAYLIGDGASARRSGPFSSGLFAEA